MSSETTQTTLEDKYIEESKKFFDNQNSEIIEEIYKSIFWVSTRIITTLNIVNISPEQREEELWDVTEYISSDLKNNKKFSDLLDQFVLEKIKEIEISTKKKIEETLDQKTEEKIACEPEKLINKTIDEKINDVLAYAQELEEHIVAVNDYKQTIIEMWEVLSPKILVFAIRLLNEVKAWLNTNTSKIFQSLDTITELLIDIWMEAHSLKLTEDQENNLYNDEWGFLVDKLINKIKPLISELNDLVIVYEKQINTKSLEKMFFNEIQEKGDKNDSREKKIMNEILRLFDHDLAPRIMSSIGQLYSWIDWVIGSKKTIIEKKQEFENPLKSINPLFLNNDSRAIELFKVLAEIRIQEYLFTVDEDINLSHTIPKKIFSEVMKVLFRIVRSYLWDDINNETKKIIIKQKCNSFIAELNRTMPDLLLLIVEKRDINMYKVREIKDILVKLNINAKFHNDFMKVVDLYYEEKRESIVFESVSNDSENITPLDLAYLKLKEDFSNSNKTELNLYQDFIRYVQINMTFEIAKDIVNIMSKEHEASLKSNNTSEIVKRMSMRTGNWAYKNESPYAKLLSTATHKNEAQKTPFRIKLDMENRKATRDNRVNEIITNFLNIFSYIDDSNPSIRPKLVVFMKTYYEYKILEALKEHNKTNELFSNLRNGK